MKKFIEELMFKIGLYGEKAGWTIILIVFLYDPMITGFRGFLEWRIAPLGYIVAMIGGLLISLSKHIKERF